MRVLVTGGNAGIGYFVVEQLASVGVEVVIGGRDPAKAEAAVVSVRARVAGAEVGYVEIVVGAEHQLVASFGLTPRRVIEHDSGVADDGVEPTGVERRQRRQVGEVG